MYCAECGESLNENAKFCFKCGAKQPEKEAAAEESAAANGSDAEKPEAALPSSKPSFVLPDMVEDSVKADSAVLSLGGRYIAIKKTIYHSLALMVGTSDELQIMDATTREISWSGNEKRISKLLAVSDNGLYLALARMMGENLNMSLLDVQDGVVSDVAVGVSKGGLVSFLGIALNKEWSGNAFFTEDSKRLAFRQEQAWKIANVPQGNELLSCNGDDKSWNLTLSHDGRYLAILSGIWDARTGSKLYDLDDEGCGAFSHDGKRIATASQSTIKIWDVANGNMLHQFDRQGVSEYEVSFMRFSPDDRAIVIGYNSNGLIQIFDSETGEMLKQLQGGTGGIEWVSYSADGQKLISYDGEHVKFWVQG